MNLAREDEAFVLITGASRHRRFEVELRDLRSRLRAVPVVSLLPPDDQLFRALIVKFCADRQSAVDETVVSYLATRIERSYAAARQAVELLDTEALAAGPAGDPGAGGGIAAQRLICRNAPALTAQCGEHQCH
jgi:chromosomal replication initiation ATPase DnaA